MLPVKELNETIEETFFSFIDEKAFPCVGAKTALAKRNIQVVRYGDINSPDQDVDLLSDIHRFVENFNIEENMYSSFVAVFDGSREMSERCFEKALWRRLQALHDIDSKLYNWDSTVSADPESKDFSFSLGGKGFFIIGLNPNSKRRSRQFDYPALVFNMHSQFARLREQGKFEQLRDHIYHRDEQYCGSKNPVLANHGEQSEAQQYSGRVPEEDWECPLTVNKEAKV